MVAGTIPIKTPEGQAELSTRKRRVSQRHRTVLFLIDGKRSVAEVRDLALQAGVPDTCFDELVTLGLIMVPATTVLTEIPAAPLGMTRADVPLAGPDSLIPDSILPPSRTLYPSVSTDSSLGDLRPPESWLNSVAAEYDGLDAAFAEARLILVRAVRAEAPIAGSLTLMRLRRARTRDDLRNLLDEVEGRITKPRRSLAASHTLRRVRQLIDGRPDSAFESF